MAFLRPLLPVCVLLAVAACTPASVDDSAVTTEVQATTQGSDSDTTEAPELVVSSGELSITVRAHPSNTLLAIVDVATSSDSQVAIKFESADTAVRVITSEAAGTEHSFTVPGLRAETEYVFTAEAVGSSQGSEPIRFTTGELPQSAPSVEVAVQRAESPDAQLADGITFFGVANSGPGQAATEGPSVFGVDSAGEVVWYLESDKEANRDPVVRDLGDGELLVFFAGELARMNLAGDVLESFDLSAVSSWHHDAVLLSDGGVLALDRETRDVGGTTILGDLIVELDTDGEVVWEWSAIDHLDPTRFPGDLSLGTSRAPGGGLDWSHGNSVFYDEATDSILFSSRSQNWVVNIDRQSGDLIWIAGESTSSAANFDGPFLNLTSGSWTSAQHAATWTEDGRLLVYDNRNETGGDNNNSRVVAYEIDESAGSAAQVFEYIAPKYTGSLGDVDELVGGNVLLTAGGPGSSSNAHLVEVDKNGETVWEATTEQRIYRSERMTWTDIDSVLTADTSAGSDSDPETESDPEPVAGTVDITDAVLVSTDANCATYAGSYTANVNDAQTGEAFVGVLTISTESDICTLESNQIPNHDFGEGARFPNEVAEIAGRFEITSSPEVGAQSTELGFTVHAVMLNGVIWEAYPAACYGEGTDRLGNEKIGCGPSQLDNPWRYNVGSPLNGFQLDDYSAHAQATGLYHYHSTPQALYEIECNGETESPVVGFARDGFPIYGPCFTDDSGAIRSAESSYALKDGDREDVAGFDTPTVVGSVAGTEHDGQFIGDYEFVSGLGDLDECNGMEINGQYGYYITGGYPYVLACYAGTPSAVFGPS